MELDAPSHWNCIDFISDLHLQASDPLTFLAWKDYLHDTQADAVFILGDLFEVWVGDDILSLPSSFEARCAEVLSAASHRFDLYLMHGNRDFLMGSAFMAACGGTALIDPTVLTFANQRWLLTHGDAWCRDDTAYMQFREQVRGPQWQHAFLNKPLDERMDIAKSLRQQSDARKQTQTTYADVDTATATAQMASERASHIIHGHTHRPARHPIGQVSERLVLSDWDMAAMPPRGEVLRLRRSVLGVAESFTVERIPPAMAARSSQATPTPVD